MGGDHGMDFINLKKKTSSHHCSLFHYPNFDQWGR
jgi:hypothetical protein